MRLDKMLDILYGSLVNMPCVSSFSSVSCDASRIKKGALFFLQDDFSQRDSLQKKSLQKELKAPATLNMISLAISKGACGIVFSGNISPILDNEIAWIKVDDIEKSIFRLARYLILEGNYVFLMLSPLELECISHIKTSKDSAGSTGSVKILCGQKLQDVLEYFFYNYEERRDSKQTQTIMTSIKELEKIEALKICSRFYTRDMQSRCYDFSHNRFIKVIDSTILKIKVVSHSMFITRVMLDDKLLNLNYPYIFLPFLQSVLCVVKYANENLGENIECFLRENIESFGSVFIDSKGNFTTTQRTVAVVFLPNPKALSLTFVDLYDFKNSFIGNLNFESDLYKNFGNKLHRDSKDNLKGNSFVDSDDNFGVDNKSDSKKYPSVLSLLMRHFKIHASHLNMLLCYKSGKNGFSVKKPLNRCIVFPYPHISHLSQILLKTSYQLAIICGAKKSDFGKKSLKIGNGKNPISKNRGLFGV